LIRAPPAQYLRVHGTFNVLSDDNCRLSAIFAAKSSGGLHSGNALENGLDPEIPKWIDPIEFEEALTARHTEEDRSARAARRAKLLIKIKPLTQCSDIIFH
jgi:hypothetical protein